MSEKTEIRLPVDAGLLADLAEIGAASGETIEQVAEGALREYVAQYFMGTVRDAAGAAALGVPPVATAAPESAPAPASRVVANDARRG